MTKAKERKKTILEINEQFRNVIPDALIKPEVNYEGSSSYIPELKVSVKIRKGKTLKEWIAKYCINHPVKRSVLFEKYNITPSYLEETGITTTLMIRGQRSKK
jgi:hypothetical protein